jgi:hypothetical protein
MSLFNRIVLITTIMLLAWVYGRMAVSSQLTDEELFLDSIVEDIRRLQPKVGMRRAHRLAEIIMVQSVEHSISSKLIVGVIMRESSYHPSIENLERYGNRGEIGLMQIMPNGAAMSLRPSECSSALESAYCQIATGVAWLAYARDHCPGSMATWLAGYNGRCLDHEEAMSQWHVQQAMQYYNTLERWED